MFRNGVLFIIQNLPLPRDRRVLQEASAVSERGIPVYAICPRGLGKKLPLHEVLPGNIHVYRYPNPPITKNKFSYFFEFTYCFCITFIISFWIFIRRGFRIIHTANPPDTFFLLALFYKCFFVKFIYDQHDLCPELYLHKFGASKTKFLLKALYWLEKGSYHFADHVIVPNESYEEIAITRGKLNPDKVSIVRSAPDLDQFSFYSPNEKLKEGAKYLLLYLGVMGSQDGVDILLHAFAQMLILKKESRNDFLLVLLGDGECKGALEKLSSDLEINDRIRFLGFTTGRTLFEYLSSADIGVSPDLPTNFNNLSTMNKVMEYMAYGLPVVAFDLKETHRLASEAAMYVKNPTFQSLAESILELLQDTERRKKMSSIGKNRVADIFNWRFSRNHLEIVYKNLKV